MIAGTHTQNFTKLETPKSSRSTTASCFHTNHLNSRETFTHVYYHVEICFNYEYICSQATEKHHYNKSITAFKQAAVAYVSDKHRSTPIIVDSKQYNMLPFRYEW